ncbi:hypothetical protein OUZ56_004491 [Daphnia magna]|uniref:Uncharacterized protein n=1 Tax=Daphnia magna TaxID=35525 RepID=A0ABQ9YQ71_9CRUS|nr:hypothetical protein OUZ56_004491 [Daphnia magna]
MALPGGASSFQTLGTISIKEANRSPQSCETHQNEPSFRTPHILLPMFLCSTDALVTSTTLLTIVSNGMRRLTESTH